MHSGQPGEREMEKRLFLDDSVSECESQRAARQFYERCSCLFRKQDCGMDEVGSRRLMEGCAASFGSELKRFSGKR